MEEIKITIVNDHASGSKRERDEATELSPYAKKLRHDVFSCSTPSSASAHSWATQHRHFLALRSQSEDTEEEELDDSILDRTADEEDSDSDCSYTKEQIETMLRDDNDDTCYAAEPREKCNVVVTFRPSESEGENGGDSLYKTLDVLDVSNTLTEEPESEGDYAAMPPSPCKSALDQVEVIKPILSSVYNVKSPNELPTAKAVLDSDLSTPLLEIKKVSSQAPNSFSPKRLLQTSICLPKVDAALYRSECLDFSLDDDIDNLLPLSPGVAFSSHRDNGVELAAITTKEKSSGISDSKAPPQNSEFNQVLSANIASCSTSSDAAQHYSPLSLNTAALSKDPHYHHTAEPEPSKVPSTTSPVVSVTPKPSIASLRNGKTVEFEKPEVEESKAVQNGEPSSTPTGPTTPNAAPTVNGIQSKIVAPSCCKVQGSTDPEKEKPRIAIAPVCRPSFRAFLSDLDLENKKNIYCHHVLMHINNQRECKLEDPFNELSSLLNQTSRDNQNWQHPSDLSKRNHPRCGKKPSSRCTLTQWESKNGGSNERFKDFPNTFQRSPIPTVLPFSSS